MSALNKRLILWLRSLISKWFQLKTITLLTYSSKKGVLLTWPKVTKILVPVTFVVKIVHSYESSSTYPVGCLVLWHINRCRLFNAKSIFMQIVIQFHTNQLSMSIQFNCQKDFSFKLFSLVKQFYFKQFSLA